MADNVILAKAEIIERCIKRAREELAASADFDSDHTRQDAAILNVERACEAAIDIMNRIVRLRGLGAPNSTRDGFARLVGAVISRNLDDLLEFSAIALRLTSSP